MGYAVTNAGIELNPKVGIADGFNSLINTPVRYVLATLFTLVAATVLLIIWKTVGWPRKEFLLEIGKRRSETDRSVNNDKNEKPEFDFHLRIRIPPRKQNSQSDKKHP